MKKYSKYFIILFSIITVLVSICFVPISASKLIPVIESQVSKELGLKVHIEKLILRVGPSIKLKAPIMHIMYKDGHKIAQIDNVKFYIPWHTFLKENTSISRLQARKLIIRINSDDKYLEELVKRINARKISENPNLRIKEYSFSYLNKKSDDKYIFEGQLLETNKIKAYDSFNIKTIGSLQINNKKYINYDVFIEPRLNLSLENSLKLDLVEIMTQVKELDFNSDIIADLKVYNSQDNVIQASGFVNIDNISVLDVTKKNPKSFAYLTLWGDKASLLSNIYTSPNKKVYIEGMINNSKKPILDLKVKAEEISLGELFKKLRILTCFSQFKNISSVDGKLNANFTVKGDIHKIKSNGYLKVLNANIVTNGVKIDKINSDIDFSNNAINIVNATGYVNKSPIMLKGKIDKNIDLEVLMNKVELKHIIPSEFGIKGGIASLVAKISGTFDKITHTENLQIDSFKFEKYGVSLTLDNLKMDTSKNSSAYLQNLICHSDYTETIKIPSLKILLERDFLKIPETNIYLPNSKLTLKSNITNYNNPNFVFNTVLDGFINSKDIKHFKNSSFRYPVCLQISGNKNTQNLNLQILSENTLIFDEPVVVNLATKIDKNAIKIDDLSIVSFTGKFSNDLKNNLKGTKKLILTGAIENFEEPIIKNIRIFIPQILNLHYYDTVSQIKGDLFINGNINKPDIVGQLLIQNLYNQSAQLALNNSTIEFNKNNFVFNAPLLKLADSSMSVNSTILTDINNGIVIKNAIIKSKYLNTDTLLMYKDLPILKQVPIIINDGKFYSEKVLANLYNSPLYISSFNSDFSLNDNTLSLKNISAELFNGKLGGCLDYNLKNEHYHSNVMARGVSAEPIFNIISSRKDNISGSMDFDTDITGELISKQSLNGNVKFVVNNGRMSSLGKLEHLLYAQNVIADNLLRTSLSVVTRAITLKDTGLFKFLRGDIILENGIANINMLQSQGPLMALFIKGQYNPVNDYAQLLVLGRLSDEVISGLGTFGDFSFNKLMIMLTGEENKCNVYPEDYNKIPQLPVKNTKEFRSIINGIVDRPSSVLQFNWISYSEKSLKQKEVQMTEEKVPDFVDKLPY